MRITFQSKGDFSRAKSWLSGVINKSPVETLRQVAREGEESLARATPVDTGATASGWTSEITSTRRGADLSWMNVAHPHTSVNIAKIIDTGHGTGTGGYVPPRPYIKNAMSGVWVGADKAIEEMMK